MQLSVVPANEVSSEDLARVFADTPSARECWCQRYRLPRGEAFRHHPAEVRARRLREQTQCGHPGADRTTGLVALLGREAVGWCQVTPRASLPGLVRNASMAAWAGRAEDRADPGVWALTCLVVRREFRRQGVGSALVTASIAFAREQGATCLEGYPIEAPSGVSSEDHPGLLVMFLDAGFQVVHQPSKRRRVVAIDFTAGHTG